MTHLEAAEMRFLRSVKGYTRPRRSKKRSHKKRTRDLWNTRREIQIQTKLEQPSGKNGQQQNWETTLNYKPRGRRDRGRPRIRWQRVDAGTGQAT